MAKQKRIAAYTSKAEIIGDLLAWSELSTLSTRREDAKQAFETLVRRLGRPASKKYLLGAFLQENKLNNAELFILLRALSRTFTGGVLRDCAIPSLLQQGKPYAGPTDFLRVLIDEKSVLMEKHILSITNDNVVVENNLLKKKPLPAKKKTRTFFPKKVLAELNRYVIGQEDAKKQLVAGVFEHLAKCAAQVKDGIARTKNNILISGPTGSGKSYLCQSLAKILGIPFLHLDATKYTCSGYKGLDIASAFLSLADKNGKLPVSLVFIDEIDKLCDSGPIRRGDVQDEFLRVLEENTVTAEGLSKIPRKLDISQVLFVAGGAFSGLKLQEQRKLGFRASESLAANTVPTPTDFVRYGLKAELVGRFSYQIRLNPLTRQDLERILLNPQYGPVAQYNCLFNGKDRLSPRQVNEIVTAALERKMGARGLFQDVQKLFRDKFLQQSVTLAY